MAKRTSGRQRKSLWSQSGPTPRLLFGAFAIAAVGLLGLTPKTLLGLSIAWPYAALWGAVGWGRVGLSLRPMLLLIAFGLIQDISFNAPFGCFVIVNLVVYGFSAWIASMFDVMNEPLVAVVAPVLQFISGFLVLWLLASALEEYAVRATPLLAAFLTTGVIYAMCHKVFDLGRTPGQPVGQTT